MGREQALIDLHTLLQGENAVAIAAISGMGGIGKTELAVQYAWMHLRQKTYPGGVLWLKAREEVATQIVLFARSLPMPQPPDDFDPAAKVAFYWRNWQDARTLVILDDVQDYSAIKPLLPVDPRFKILLTTRLKLQSPVQNFEIEVLSEEKALELLGALVERDRPDLRGLPNLGGLETAKQICEWLGYLPLGIELVGRYLVWDEDVTLTVLWQRLQEKRTDAIALKQTYSGMTASDGVAAAFELSWQTLTPPTQQLACLLSLFALAEIPWTLVEACLPEADAEELQRLRNSELVGLHLLERTGQGMYQLHQLLREFFAAKRSQRADTADMEQAFRDAVLAAAQRSTETPERSLFAETTVLIPHLQAVVQLSETSEQETDVALDLSWLAELYRAQGRYAEAEPRYTRALEIRARQLGADHPDVATSLNNLAGLYRAQGRYAEAEPRYTRALEIYERQLGADHPAVATSLNNLAALYQAQGRYAEAEPRYTRALEIRARQLGADHPDVASSLNNLAGLYYAQGRYAEAEPLFTRALEIYERQLGADHPAVATSLNNLAGLYEAQGRYAEAEPRYTRALEISERQLGADHPDVASSLNNLAGLYQAQGRYAEAEPLCTRALEIRERQLGADHPTVATSLNNLAGLYRAQGRYAEAEPRYLRALAILFETLGADHPNTRSGWQNFLGLLQQVIQAGKTGQLSDHPMTQDLLRQMKEGSGG